MAIENHHIPWIFHVKGGLNGKIIRFETERNQGPLNATKTPGTRWFALHPRHALLSPYLGHAPGHGIDPVSMGKMMILHYVRIEVPNFQANA